MSQWSFVKTKSFLIAIKYLYVVIKLAKLDRFYVATEKSMSR